MAPWRSWGVAAHVTIPPLPRRRCASLRGSGAAGAGGVRGGSTYLQQNLHQGRPWGAGLDSKGVAHPKGLPGCVHPRELRMVFSAGGSNDEHKQNA